jgi:hypothetical protein
MKQPLRRKKESCKEQQWRDVDKMMMRFCCWPTKLTVRAWWRLVDIFFSFAFSLFGRLRNRPYIKLAKKRKSLSRAISGDCSQNERFFQSNP